MNDITKDINSKLRPFADDCICYREIKDVEDRMKLQEDTDRIGSWARSMGIRFQPISKSNADYKEIDQEDQCLLYCRTSMARTPLEP